MCIGKKANQRKKLLYEVAGGMFQTETLYISL